MPIALQAMLVQRRHLRERGSNMLFEFLSFKNIVGTDNLVQDIFLLRLTRSATRLRIADTR